MLASQIYLFALGSAGVLVALHAYWSDSSTQLSPMDALFALCALLLLTSRAPPRAPNSPRMPSLTARTHVNALSSISSESIRQALHGDLGAQRLRRGRSARTLALGLTALQIYLVASSAAKLFAEILEVAFFRSKPTPSLEILVPAATIYFLTAGLNIHVYGEKRADAELVRPTPAGPQDVGAQPPASTLKKWTQLAAGAPESKVTTGKEE
eukprot:tig00020562_g11156.t1